jgi:tripartite-type tricarboxylate transporter receptor subunit TctC
MTWSLIDQGVGRYKMKQAIKILGKILGLTLAISSTAHAQGLEEFYRGRNVQVIIPNATGGSFDLYGRLVARHIGRFLPGTPNMVAQNMPGAGGMISANWLYDVAAKDGSVIGISVPNIALAHVLEVGSIRYDARKFNWIGRIVSPTATLYTWHTSATKTVADLRTKETLIASTGSASQAHITSQMMNGVAGAKFKIIAGYKGTTDAIIALEQGEVQAAIFPWTFIKAMRPDWITDKKLNIIAQYTRKPNPDLPGVPSIFDLAQTQEQKEVFGLFFGPDEIGQSLMMPPGVEATKVNAFRAAFTAMIQDNEFQQDADRQKLELSTAPWEDVQASIEEAYKATRAQIEIAKKYYQ